MENRLPKTKCVAIVAQTIFKNCPESKITRNVSDPQSSFPGGSDGKASAYSVRDWGSISVLRTSPQERHGDPLQYSYLGNPIDRGAWWVPWGRKELGTTERNIIFTCMKQNLKPLSLPLHASHSESGN